MFLIVSLMLSASPAVFAGRPVAQGDLMLWSMFGPQPFVAVVNNAGELTGAFEVVDGKVEPPKLEAFMKDGVRYINFGRPQGDDFYLVATLGKTGSTRPALAAQFQDEAGWNGYWACALRDTAAPSLAVICDDEYQAYFVPDGIFPKVGQAIRVRWFDKPIWIKVTRVK